MIAELPAAEICWAGPLRFYAKSGATVSRVLPPVPQAPAVAPRPRSGPITGDVSLPM